MNKVLTVSAATASGSAATVLLAPKAPVAPKNLNIPTIKPKPSVFINPDGPFPHNKR